jgi:hypothetical protein
MAELGGSMSETEGSGATTDDGRYAVLDVFGLKLEVSNPRLAELLTMDAGKALTTDVRDLASPEEVRSQRMSATQAVPEIVLAPPTPRDEMDEKHRREFRAQVGRIGGGIGFESSPDGIWRSPSGLTILTRGIDRPVSFAAASHFVGEIAAHREALAGPDSTALFVVDGQQSADVFKVAIRQSHLYNVMRVISIDNLVEIERLVIAGVVDHAKTLVLLTPAANIDVGEILSVMRATDEVTPAELGY